MQELLEPTDRREWDARCAENVDFGDCDLSKSTELPMNGFIRYSMGRC
jgi:hypothetical protein